MTVVENEAILFAKFFLQKAYSVKLAKEELDKKLSNFLLDKDKLYFLRVLHNENDNNYNEHKKQCKNPNCQQDKSYPISVFAIDQQIGSIEKYYFPQIEITDDFSVKEKSDLHNRINEIFEEVEKLGLGQEIIFNDLDELRQHFNLGKKNWLKFLKGTLITIAIEKGLEKTIIDSIFQKLSDTVNEAKNILE